MPFLHQTDGIKALEGYFYVLLISYYSFLLYFLLVLKIIYYSSIVDSEMYVCVTRD